MTREPQQAAEARLEGLLLRDGHGNIYEVPCTVIERYCVTEERAAELRERLATDRRASSAGPDQRTVLWWALEGGISADHVTAGDLSSRVWMAARSCR